MLSIIEIFGKIEDVRINRKKKYPLIEIIVVAIGTMLCGGRTYREMEICGNEKLDFFKSLSPEQLPFKNGIPSEDTFARVMGMLSPKNFRECLIEWVKYLKKSSVKIAEGINEIIGLDGKAVRGSKTKKEEALVILNAFATQSGLTIGEIAVENKTNEITALPKLLSLLELQNAVATIDAIGCQKKNN